jgi:hypothetical protein
MKSAAIRSILAPGFAAALLLAAALALSTCTNTVELFPLEAAGGAGAGGQPPTGGGGTLPAGGSGGIGGAGTGGECPEEPCKLVLPQCGCPPGYACKPLQDGNDVVLACIEPGPAGLGELCHNGSECTTGYGCWGMNTGGPFVGACTPYCYTDADCPPLTHCLGGYICFQNCDPVLQTGCPSTLHCVIGFSQDDTIAGGTCSPFGTGQQGDACTTFSCKKGHFCISGSCHQFCRLGEDDCIIGNCTPITPEAEFNGVSYGACV